MIRKIKRKDKENWIKLYCGYARFYKVPMKQEILDTLWKWIHDEIHDVNGICYELDNKIVGIAHYRTMPRPIKGKHICFLDDLFVDENFRGQKIAQKLIKYLETLSKDNNSCCIIATIVCNSIIVTKAQVDKPIRIVPSNAIKAVLVFLVIHIA